MALNYFILGKRIQFLRSNKKISQIRFAELIDKSPTFVSCMERGIKHPSLETLVEIACILNVSFEEILEGNLDLQQAPDSQEKGKLLKNCSAFDQFVITECARALRVILQDAENIRSHSDND